jgi:hypothetical protein
LFRALFGPSVQAGIVRPADLAGYRNDPVFIRGALHVPPPKAAVRACMPVLFALLGAETAPQVRAVPESWFGASPTISNCRSTPDRRSRSDQ